MCTSLEISSLPVIISGSHRRQARLFKMWQIYRAKGVRAVAKDRKYLIAFYVTLLGLQSPFQEQLTNVAPGL